MNFWCVLVFLATLLPFSQAMLAIGFNLSTRGIFRGPMGNVKFQHEINIQDFVDNGLSCTIPHWQCIDGLRPSVGNDRVPLMNGFTAIVTSSGENRPLSVSVEVGA